LQCLTKCGVDTDACFQNAAWRFARAEPWQAYFACDLSERGVDIAVKFGLVNLDGELDHVAF
jgi:hypothetical protein